MQHINEMAYMHDYAVLTTDTTYICTQAVPLSWLAPPARSSEYYLEYWVFAWFGK